MSKIERTLEITYANIRSILKEARKTSFRTINHLMVGAYWNIGKVIVEEEQKGKTRANYGSFLMEELSRRLSSDYGKGFSKNNLWYMRQFYLSFPILHAARGESDIHPSTLHENTAPLSNSLRKELSWTHYRLLLKVEKPEAREKDFAIILEDDADVIKWLRPAQSQFRIYWQHNSREYTPDFVAETFDGIYMIETKKQADVASSEVKEKANAALQYCKHATEFTSNHRGKPWKYILIPHDVVMLNMSFSHLMQQNEYKNP